MCATPVRESGLRLPAQEERNLRKPPRLCAKVARGSELTTPVRKSVFVQQSQSYGSVLGLGAHKWSPRSHRLAALAETLIRASGGIGAQKVSPRSHRLTALVETVQQSR